MTKKSFLLFSFLSFGVLGSYAKHHLKRKSKHANIDVCTQTFTASKTAQVTCPDGAIITITSYGSATVTSDDCYTAYYGAISAATNQAQTAMNKILQTKDYICP